MYTVRINSSNREEYGVSRHERDESFEATHKVIKKHQFKPAILLNEQPAKEQPTYNSNHFFSISSHRLRPNTMRKMSNKMIPDGGVFELEMPEINLHPTIKRG